MHTAVLFDIDGTIINKLPNITYRSRDRFIGVFQEVFGKTPEFDWKELDGQGDRRIFEILAQDTGIAPEEITEKFPLIKEKLVRSISETLLKEKVYQPIESAIEFLKLLSKEKNIIVGIISGNFRQTAKLKLKQVHLETMFHFDIFSDDAENRNAMAKLVVPKLLAHFGEEIRQQHIFIVGDTVFDIRSAKAAGLRSIAVNTGPSATWEQLQQEKPELLVKSLLDPRVINLIRSSYE